MAFFRCDVMSESLGMATSVLVTMPDTGDLAAAPVVYLLHGLTDNCTGWLRYTQAEHLARTHGAILIVPEVQRSFYTDMACGQQDSLYPANLRLRDTLQAMNWPLTWYEAPGDHNWFFWNDALGRAMKELLEN